MQGPAFIDETLPQHCCKHFLGSYFSLLKYWRFIDVADFLQKIFLLFSLFCLLMFLCCWGGAGYSKSGRICLAIF